MATSFSSPQTTPIGDAKNRQWVAQSSRALRQSLRNRNKDDLIESTGVVPAKYPLKVKLERISITLEC